MLRLVGFFALAVLLASLLGNLPFVGPIFRHSGIFGILLASALLSAVFTRFGERMVQSRKMRSEIKALGSVETAHNQGKLGAIHLARGRARTAIEHLEHAVSGEPEVADWHYRLGLACLATGRLEQALGALERCVALEEEHAYGAAQMRRAECLQRLGRNEEALQVLGIVERNHGPSPEHSYRRGLSLRALGRRAEASQAFAEVGQLARSATRYQRRVAGLWALRAGLRRWV